MIKVQEATKDGKIKKPTINKDATKRFIKNALWQLPSNSPTTK